MDSLDRLIEAGAVERLRQRDASLFATDYDRRKRVMQRLGWTDLAHKAPSRFTLLDNLASQVAAEGCTDVVLVGMGGSSLAPMVLGEALGGRTPGAPRLRVLDTTCPRTVFALQEELERDTTFLVVSSKSGTTVEPLSLYAILRAWLEEGMERPDAGRRCMVVTDPGSPLEALRLREVMRLTLHGVPSVGGRFSALSMFGLAPAALAGVDIRGLVERAQRMEVACGSPAEANPSALLAAWLSDRFDEGRDKLTLVCSESLRSFGLWIEQLIAESTGKGGVGVVPVPELHTEDAPSYGDDRAVAIVRLAADTRLADWAVVTGKRHPVFEIVLDDPLDIGGEFVRWMHATALLGHLLGIDPFDEPDVAAAKEATGRILSGSASAPQASDDLGGVWATFAGGLERPAQVDSLETALESLIGSMAPRDYLALLAYLPEDEWLCGPLRAGLHSVGSATKRATCLEMGPRYLHSTGQLHKGGPNTGAFLMVTARDRIDSLVPGSRYTLGGLFRAQAEGDLLTLAAAGRRVLRLDLPEPTLGAVDRLAGALHNAR